MKSMPIRLFFRYRPWQRRDRIALRYRCLIEQRTVERNIIRGHACGRESLLELSSNSVTVERNHAWEHPHRLIHSIDDGARDPLVDDFRNGTMTESKDGSAARHRLDHHQAERLGPVDREQERQRIAQELGLAALIDLA